MKIETVIFDLGGVLLGIDVARAVEAFRALVPEGVAFPPAHELLEQELFKQFETGAMDPAGFRKGMRNQFGVRGTDDEIDAAWNALLLEPLPGRTTFLEQLASCCELILLSNTNRIHYQAFTEPCKNLFAPFKSLIFSFETGFRKPQPQIFQLALDQTNHQPSECIFIDDSLKNLDGAAKLGIQTYHCQTETDWISLTKLLLK